MRKHRRSWARRLRIAAVGLLPAVVLVSMLVAERPAVATDGPPATTITGAPMPDLQISKTADLGSVVAGNQIGFLITLTNAGGGPASDVTLTDPIPVVPGTSWSIDTTMTSGWPTSGSPACAIASNTLTCGGSGETFQGGDSATVHIVSGTNLETCDPTINEIGNTAAYSASAPTGAPLSGSDEDWVTVTCPPGVLAFSKMADESTISAGDQIGFTMTASNAGASPIGDVLIHDLLPTNDGLTWTIDPADADCSIFLGALNCDFGTLAAGASHSVHIDSPTDATTCGTVANTATASLGEVIHVVGNAEPNVTPPEITKSASVDVLCPNLTITKTPDLYRAAAGKPMSWTITVANTGPGTARGVFIYDALDFGGPYSVDDTTHCSFDVSPAALSCFFGDMAAGSSHTIHLTAVLSSLSDCGEISNIAVVGAPNLRISSAPAITKVTCPNVAVTKTADYGTNTHPSRGFDITVTSAGTAPVKNVKLTDPLASGAKWSIVGGNGKAKCHIKSGTLTCSYGTMKPGKSFTVHIKATQVPCEPIANTATVSATNEPSFEAGDNTATAHVGCVI